MNRIVRFVLCTAIGISALPALGGSDAVPAPASTIAIGLDRQIKWDNARLIAVQDDQRNKTLESFAREKMTAMTGKDHLPGLSSIASLFEWLFNMRGYVDEPVVYVRDKGLRIEFSLHLPGPARQFILETGRFTPRQIADRAIQNRIQELEPRFEMVSAIRRVSEAQFVAFNMGDMLRIVPAASGGPEAAWHTPGDLIDTLPAELAQQLGLKQNPNERPIEGISANQATEILLAWSNLRVAWSGGDAARVQQSLDQLATLLPSVAGPGVYPKVSQRAAEAKYYALGKFTWGWMFYFAAAVASFWALITNWRVPWLISAALLLIALAFHAYGISLRWYILDRIPVANMFEAVVSSAWAGIALAFVLELVYRVRVFFVAASAAGFLALVLGGYVIPGGGTLTSIMGILDDVMLRIHTVLIIWSYALIFIASIIAIVYLFQYYFYTAPAASSTMGLAIAFCGAALYFCSLTAFQTPVGGTEVIKSTNVGITSGVMVIILAAMITYLSLRSSAGIGLSATILAAVTMVIVYVGNQDFIWGSALSLLGAGLLWSLFTGAGLLMNRARSLPRPVAAPAMASGMGTLMASHEPLMMQRPVLAGALPGDEARSRDLPQWLQQLDWCHLIILNMVFVMLFVGLILGAVWADYSWGRPWGWDPKEVFALNTWIIYAILIHARFVVKNRGLWTAWLSIIGCLMMAFNWCFVNFFIVGLHSYA